MTHRRLRFALCALLVSAPLTTLAADNHGMFSAGSFYASLNWDVAFSAQRDLALLDEDKKELAVTNIETGFGFLGAQIGVGYAISGFRPEVYGAYRRTPITGVTIKKIGEAEVKADAGINTGLKTVEWGNSAISSLDLGLGVHYDIDTGTPLLPYLGIAGGASNITLTVAEESKAAITTATSNALVFEFETSESAWAFGFQGDAGIGYAVTDDVVVTLGYRLTGTTEVELPTSNTKLRLALVHNGELGLRYVF